MLPSYKLRIDGYGHLPVAVIEFDDKVEVLSSCIHNGGMRDADTIAIMQVDPDYMCDDPLIDVKNMMEALSLPDDTVVFMTAAEVDRVITEASDAYKGYCTASIATAGLSNQVIAGDELTDWERKHEISQKRREALMSRAGTINTIGIVDRPLTDNAKVNALIAMTEAKTAAMQDLGWKETGTTSDAVAIVCPAGGDRISYCGTGFGAGISLARSVRACIRGCLIKRGDFPYDMSDEDIERLRKEFQ